jgi:hypothetical protein
MKTGRPAALIELSDEEHLELLRRSRQRKGVCRWRVRHLDRPQARYWRAHGFTLEGAIQSVAA